jgi:hypothetical protein
MKTTYAAHRCPPGTPENLSPTSSAFFTSTTFLQVAQHLGPDILQVFRDEKWLTLHLGGASVKTLETQEGAPTLFQEYLPNLPQRKMEWKM